MASVRREGLGVSRRARCFFAALSSGVEGGNTTTGVGSGHATFSLGLVCAPGATKCFSARAVNIFLLLSRRLIFSLRRRLNLALSPLIPDIFIS